MRGEQSRSTRRRPRPPSSQCSHRNASSRYPPASWASLRWLLFTFTCRRANYLLRPKTAIFATDQDLTVCATLTDLQCPANRASHCSCPHPGPHGSLGPRHVGFLGPTACPHRPPFALRGPRPPCCSLFGLRMRPPSTWPPMGGNHLVSKPLTKAGGSHQDHNLPAPGAFRRYRCPPECACSLLNSLETLPEHPGAISPLQTSWPGALARAFFATEFVLSIEIRNMWTNFWNFIVPFLSHRIRVLSKKARIIN